MADPVEKVQREIAVETFRSMALRLRIQSSLMVAQAESLESAAERIASGEADVDTLRLVEEPSVVEGTEPVGDEEVERRRWRGMRERVLRAVVEAAHKPATDIEAAGLNRLQEAAGFKPDEEQDFLTALRELQEARLVEHYRVPHPHGVSAPYAVCLPTEAGLDEVGEVGDPARFPADSIIYEVPQMTRELPSLPTLRDGSTRIGGRS